MLENSEDRAVRSIQPQLRTGRKWKDDKAVNQTKDGLKMKEVIGLTQTGRKGLGSGGVKWWGKQKITIVIWIPYQDPCSKFDSLNTIENESVEKFKLFMN
ncbi:reverse transcriptase [Plakobranchus ocellatus]|uniref:Reverse transcriptase n=1 Tax=Plakobranchus ocellatus TaxID=259542 RepID=A0AAV4AFI1_9GAST|nr:reverse transcriptase [Plakobranchus ocellatus]